MGDDEENPEAKILSQYEQVKAYVAELHTDFMSAYRGLCVNRLLGRRGEREKRMEHLITAYSCLIGLRHYGPLSGAIMDRKDPGLKKIDTFLDNWNKITKAEMRQIVDLLDDWFAQSYFFDARVDTDKRGIIDIEKLLSEASL